MHENILEDPSYIHYKILNQYPLYVSVLALFYYVVILVNHNEKDFKSHNHKHQNISIAK